MDPNAQFARLRSRHQAEKSILELAVDPAGWVQHKKVNWTRITTASRRLRWIVRFLPLRLALLAYRARSARSTFAANLHGIEYLSHC